MSFEALLATADQAVAGRLGRTITYAPSGGAPVEVTGIYDRAHTVGDPGTPGIVTTTPAVFLVLSELPSDPEEDDPVITVGAETFEVRDVQKDSVGLGVLLLLSKVS